MQIGYTISPNGSLCYIWNGEDFILEYTSSHNLRKSSRFIPVMLASADPRELPPENATEVPENESSDHASPSSDNGLSRPERA